MLEVSPELLAGAADSEGNSAGGFELVQNTFDRSQYNQIWMKELEILRWQLTAITRAMATMMIMLEKETSTNTSSCAPCQRRYDHGHDDDDDNSNYAAEEDVDQPLALVHLANAAI